MAVGAAGVIGAGASYAGSKKQAGAAQNASAQQMEMFRTLNAQQQPFIQSGYGAMGRLNTLLGLGNRGAAMPAGGGTGMPPVVNNGPNGPGVRLPPRIPYGPQTQSMQPAANQQQGNLRLKQLLALRAANGDTEAERILGTM